MPLFEIVTEEQIVRTVRRTYSAETREDAVRMMWVRVPPESESVEERRQSVEITDGGRPQERLNLG
jgi:hypothetical protein